MTSHQQYLDLYREHLALVTDGSPAALNAAREEACRRLEAYGLPSQKEERYKYTDVAEAFSPDYGLNLHRFKPQADPYEAYKCNVPNLSTSLFFVVNDVPCPAPACSRALLPEGVIVCSLREAAERHGDLLEKYYHRAAGNDRDFRHGGDGVTALNTLLVQDGLLVYLPAGVRLKAPIQLVNVSDAATDYMSIRRLLVIAEAGSEGALLLCDHSEGNHRYLTNQVIETSIAKDARIDLYSIEETHAENRRFSTVYAELDERAHLSYDGVTLTCGQSRNRLDVRLKGQGATAELYGAVIADGTQKVDNNILVEHLAPGCTSEMRYKYVLDDESTGAFAGKVYVAPGAQQTASEQTNANILASQKARAWSQPMLEIYADDVKCNHGSTIGKLDENALLYMRQRGIPEAEARLLLQHAFINEILRHVRIPHLQERLSGLVDLRFRGEAKQCGSCRMCRR